MDAAKKVPLGKRSGQIGERSEGSGVFPSLRSPVIDDAMRAFDDDGVVHGGLGMRRYVAIGALLRAFPRPRKGEVLALLGLTDKDWERGRLCWMAALRASGDEAGALLETWSTAFDAAWETLQADPPSMEDLEAARARAALAPEVPTYMRPGDASANRLQSTMPSLGIPAARALPFRGKLDAPPAIAPAPMTVRSKLGATVIAAEGEAVNARVLPFSAATGVPARESAATPIVELTVEQYASLTVELQAWPAQRAATLARYGVADETAWRALEASWTPRIAWEPGVVARWSDACKAYRAWLLERARAPK